MRFYVTRRDDGEVVVGVAQEREGFVAVATEVIGDGVHNLDDIRTRLVAALEKPRAGGDCDHVTTSVIHRFRRETDEHGNARIARRPAWLFCHACHTKLPLPEVRQ